MVEMVGDEGKRVGGEKVVAGEGGFVAQEQKQRCTLGRGLCCV